eukprot:224401_1
MNLIQERFKRWVANIHYFHCFITSDKVILIIKFECAVLFSQYMSSHNQLHFKDSSKNKWNSQRISKHYKNNQGKYHRWWWDWEEKAKSIKNERICHLRNSWIDRDIFITSEREIVDELGDIPNITWQCNQCTFINGQQTPFCSMCNKPFDFNHQNNKQYLNCSEQIPIMRTMKESTSRKRSKKANLDTQIDKHNDETSAMIASGEDINYFFHAENYRLQLRKNNKANINVKPISNLKSYDIQISITATEHNHYEYVNPKLFFNKTSFWMKAPMKLLNINVLGCSLKITDLESKKHIKTFGFTACVDVVIPIHITKYSCIYKCVNSIPKILHNQKLLKFVKYCLSELKYNTVPIKVNMDHIKFDYSTGAMAVRTWDVRSVLFEYFPDDILDNVLCPFIGYQTPLCIETHISNVKIEKDLFNQQSNHTAYDILHYPSTIGKIKRIYERRVPKTQKTEKRSWEHETESDTDSCLPRLFDTDSDGTDNSYSMESDKSNEEQIYMVPNLRSVEFEWPEDSPYRHYTYTTPYRYRLGYDLADDDPERDSKWWQEVRYRHQRIKQNDRVKVKCRRHYYIGTVVKVSENKWIRVKVDGHGTPQDIIVFDNTNTKQVKRIGTRQKSKTQLQISSLQRKRKAHSKANNILYSKTNFA